MHSSKALVSLSFLQRLATFPSARVPERLMWSYWVTMGLLAPCWAPPSWTKYRNNLPPHLTGLLEELKQRAWINIRVSLICFFSHQSDGFTSEQPACISRREQTFSAFQNVHILWSCTSAPRSSPFLTHTPDIHIRHTHTYMHIHRVMYVQGYLLPCMQYIIAKDWKVTWIPNNRKLVKLWYI